MVLSIIAYSLSRIGRQHFEDRLPDAALGPTRKPRVGLDRVAIDNDRLAGEIGSRRRTSCRQQRSNQRDASDGIASDAVHHSTNTSTIAVAIKPE